MIQVFDSWAGALSVADYRAFCLAPTTELIRRIQALGVPVIYFGVDTASLLPTFRETGADVHGLDWRIPLDVARQTVGPRMAVQGNLDPITLFAPEEVIAARVREIIDLNGGPARPHLQPGPWHRARHTGRKRHQRRAMGEGVFKLNTHSGIVVRIKVSTDPASILDGARTVKALHQHAGRRTWFTAKINNFSAWKKVAGTA